MEAIAVPDIYTLPAPFDVVPPLSKGLVPLGGAAVIAVGEKTHKPKTELFGRGATIYGMGAFINALSRRVLLRSSGQFRAPLRMAVGTRYGAAAPMAASYGGVKYNSVPAQAPMMSAGNGGKYGKVVALAPPSTFKLSYPRR